MSPIHFQHGLFHVITKTAGDQRWCVQKNIPESLIKCLGLSRDIHKAQLHAFCIVSNHLHIIVRPGPKGLSAFMQTFKSNSVKEIQKKYGLKVRWEPGFYDELIRDERQCSSAVWYVLGNARKHGLVREIEDWPWTSIHYAKICDPMDIW